MQILNENDYQVFERLVSLNQENLLKAMRSFLKKYYNDIVITSRYIYAIGDIPICLTAHMDTVFKSPPKNIYYDTKKNVIWSPEGLGADDRAGVFAIIKIIQSGLRPHIMLTTDEEWGAIGASALVKKVKKPFADMKYIIQLDRRGDDDCVFYDCDNREFINYIESFGFTEEIGSFTDISIICPVWKIAGVNLSIGYRDEHSVSETFHIIPFLNTISKVIKMLKDADNISGFQYVRRKKTYWDSFNFLNSMGLKCGKCGTSNYTEYEMIPVVCKDGQTRFYCPDCIVEHVNWCIKCGQPFELKSANQVFCPNCQKEEKSNV